jgi:hypothetical protein
MKVTALATRVSGILADAFRSVVAPGNAADPMLRRSDRADFQANGDRRVLLSCSSPRSRESTSAPSGSSTTIAWPALGAVGYRRTPHGESTSRRRSADAVNDIPVLSALKVT